MEHPDDVASGIPPLTTNASEPVEVAAAALADNPDNVMEGVIGGSVEARLGGIDVVGGAVLGGTVDEDDEDEDDDDDHSRGSSAGDVDDGGDGATPSSVKKGGRGKRVHRSLPRIKTILQNETYLSGILGILEQTGCANYPFASTSNGWMTAFHNVYASVALECHHPVGKNRHLKFKEKMVEIWLAMEKESASNKAGTANNPLYALAARQLETYRRATQEEEETKQHAKRGGVRAGGSSASGAASPGSTPAALTAPSDVATAAATSPSFNPKAAAAARRGGDMPPRKKQRIQSVLKPAPQSAAAFPARRGPKGAALAVADLHPRLDRIEAALVAEEAPSNLESPLRELQSLVLQYLASPVTFGGCLATILPYYEDEARKLAAAVNEQASVAMNPDEMYQSLEALGALLRGYDTVVGNGCRTSEGLHDQLMETHQRALQAYLNLVNPQLAAAVERLAAADNAGEGDDANIASDMEDSEGVLARV